MIFESSMQLWITHNGEREKLRFPVLPTKFDVTHGTKNTSVTISGLSGFSSGKSVRSRCTSS